MSASINFGAEDGSTFILDKIDLTKLGVVTQNILFNNTDTNGSIISNITNSTASTTEIKNSSTVKLLQFNGINGGCELNGPIEGIIDNSASVGQKGDLIIKATNDAGNESDIIAIVNQPLSQFKANSQIISVEKSTSSSAATPYTYTLANILGGNLTRTTTEITSDNLITGTDLINGLPFPKNGSFFDINIVNDTTRDLSNYFKIIKLLNNGNIFKLSDAEKDIFPKSQKTYRIRIPDSSGSTYDIYHLTDHNKFANGTTRSYYNDSGEDVSGLNSYSNLITILGVTPNTTHDANTFSAISTSGTGLQNKGGKVTVEVVMRLSAKTNNSNFITIKFMRGGDVVGGPVTNIIEDNPSGCISLSAIVDLDHGEQITPEFKLATAATLTIYRFEVSGYVL